MKVVLPYRSIAQSLEQAIIFALVLGVVLAFANDIRPACPVLTETDFTHEASQALSMNCDHYDIPSACVLFGLTGGCDRRSTAQDQLPRAGSDSAGLGTAPASACRWGVHLSSSQALSVVSQLEQLLTSLL